MSDADAGQNADGNTGAIAVYLSWDLLDKNKNCRNIFLLIPCIAPSFMIGIKISLIKRTDSLGEGPSHCCEEKTVKEGR